MKKETAGLSGANLWCQITRRAAISVFCLSVDSAIYYFFDRTDRKMILLCKLRNRCTVLVPFPDTAIPFQIIAPGSVSRSPVLSGSGLWNIQKLSFCIFLHLLKKLCRQQICWVLIFHFLPLSLFGTAGEISTAPCALWPTVSRSSVAPPVSAVRKRQIIQCIYPIQTPVCLPFCMGEEDMASPSLNKRYCFRFTPGSPPFPNYTACRRGCQRYDLPESVSLACR